MFNIIQKINQHIENPVTICSELFEILNIPHTKSYLKSLLRKHVNYPSMLSIIDTLNEYSIETLPIKKKLAIEDAEYLPIICIIQEEGWDTPYYTVVKNCSDGLVEYYEPRIMTWSSMTIAEFNEIELGYLILVSESEASSEKDYTENQLNFKNKKRNKTFVSLLIIIGFSALLVYPIGSFFVAANVFYLLIGLSGVVGLFVTSVILWYEIDTKNPLLKDVCGNKNLSNVDCGAVLSAEGSSLFGIKWSVLGFSYFLTQLILILLKFSLTPDLFLFLFASTALTSLYIIYSLIYQSIVVKQWCVLCLYTQSVLLFQLLCTLTLYNAIEVTINYAGFFLISSTFIFFLSLFTTLASLGSSMLAKNKELKLKELLSNKIKYKYEVFDQILQSQKKAIQSAGVGILIGDKNAPNELIKVCNPYCRPCSNIHPQVKSLLNNNTNLKIRIIYNSTTEDFDDLRMSTVLHILGISKEKNSADLSLALDKWYLSEDKNFTQFQNEFSIEKDYSNYYDDLLAMRSWCDMMDIRATPSFFLNGREIPREYNIEDLNYLLKESQ